MRKRRIRCSKSVLWKYEARLGKEKEETARAHRANTHVWRLGVEKRSGVNEPRHRLGRLTMRTRHIGASVQSAHQGRSIIAPCRRAEALLSVLLLAFLCIHFYFTWPSLRE